MPARQVAEELLLWDAEMLRKIAPLELEGGAWMKKNKVGDAGGWRGARLYFLGQKLMELNSTNF